ncbi:MAG: TonB family protein [Wenzhouxiangellaceae bacterium]
MLELLDGELLVEALGLALLHSLWQGLLIGLVFKAVLAAAGRANPEMRYWAGVSALALLAMTVPLTTACLLADMLPAAALPAAAAVVVNTTAGELPADANGIFGAGLLVEWTVALWVAGVTVISIRTLLTWRRLSNLRDTADIAAAAPLAHMVDRLRRIFGLRGHVAIGLSKSIGSPMVIGWIKPVILLPPAIAARLPHAQLEMIVAHELAHLRRQDHWVNLFQIATETLMFYHPVVAMVSRRIRIERENACDDLAVTATRRRLDYVEMLAALETERGPGPALALGVQNGQVLARIRRLVDGSEPRTSRGAAIPALIALTAVFGLTAVPLVDEIDPAPQSSPPSSLQASSTPAERPAPVPGQPARTPDAPDDEPAIEYARPQQPSDANDEPAERDQPGMQRQATGVAELPKTGAGGPEPAPAESQAEVANVEPVTRDLNEPAAAAADVAEIAQPPRNEAPEAIVDREVPRLDTSMLLARRAETPVVLPQDAPMSSEQTEPEPVDGDAQRAARLVFSGGELLREIQPAYPRGALRREISGSVEVELHIDRNGRVADVEVLNESPKNVGFGLAARRAARQWRFEPFKRSGEPVAQRKTLVFDFRPGDGCRMVTGTRLPSC